MGRRAFAVLAVVAMLAIAVIFLRDRAVHAPKPVHEPSAPSTTHEPDTEPPALAADESPASPAPDEEEEPRTLVIEVVDRTTLAPMPDVEVRHSARSHSTRGRSLDRPDILPPYISRLRTDENGLARFEVQESTSVEVNAVTPGHLACGTFDAPRGKERERRELMLLVPDWDLTVEVVGDDSTPVAGIPVCLKVRSPTGSWGKNESTDNHGRALFPHAGYEVTRDPGQQVRVGIWVPLAEEVETLVESEPPPGEPLRLPLPPLGSVEVLVLAEDGGAVKDGTQVILRAVEPDEPRDPSLSRLLWDGFVASTSAGRALFEHVGLDLELELAARPFGERPSARALVTGPRSKGERVTTTLRLTSEPATVLRFRAVSEKGQPVFGKLEVTTSVHSRGSHGTEQSTDGEGRFEVSLEALPPGEQRELEVIAFERWGGRVDLSRSFPIGPVEMGDVVLTALPLIVAGRVIDAAGRPVVGASVLVMPGRDRTESDGTFIERRITNEAGAFSMYGYANPQRVQLHLEHEELQGKAVEVALGSTGVEIVAQEAGGIAGAVLVDPGIPPGLLDLRLRNDSLVEPSEADSSSFWWSDGLWGEEWDWSLGSREPVTRENGRFQCEDLLPGTYTLAIAIGQDVLAEFPGLTVASGEITPDPRIQAIDLRGRLHVFTLDLVPPSPGFELAGALRYTKAGTSGPERALAFGDDHRIQVLTPLAHVDATVRVMGCRTERLADLGQRTEVRIRRGVPVRLALSPGLMLPPPPLFVGVTLVDAKGERAGVEQLLFDTRGELLFHVPEPGPMRVRWFVDHNSRSSSSRNDLEMPDEQLVSIADLAEEQRFELELTNAELAAALAKR